MTFSTCPNPSSDRKSTRRLFRSAPVSTGTSSSSTRAGLAGFHTRNFAVKVPMLRNDLFDLPESQLRSEEHTTALPICARVHQDIEFFDAGWARRVPYSQLCRKSAHAT